MPDYQNHNDFSEGTARPQRLQAALSPEYFQLEERSLGDWIAMARHLAKHLRYFDFDNRENGNWSAFLGIEAQQPVAEIEAFLENPERFVHDPKRQSWLSRPHFVLFLSFLELLELEKQEINRFTRRHLDHFYREVLGIQPKAAEPDRVHLLAELARGVPEQRIEAGALVRAGQTPQGKPRYLRTQEDIVVNRAKVAEVKVFFQERKLLGLEEVFQEHIKNNPQDTQGAIAQLLLIVLPSEPVVGQNNKLFTELVSDKNWSFLSQNVKRVLNFPIEVLGLSLFELRRLNALVSKQWNERNSDWIRFNEYLLKAAKERLKLYPNLFEQLRFQARDAFEANFQIAMGFAWNARRSVYDLIQNVEDIFELFDLLQDTDKKRYDTLVREDFFLSAEDFCAMMEAFDQIRKDWRGINRLLDKIRIKNNPTRDGNWKEWPDVFNVRLGGLATDITFQQRLSNILFNPGPFTYPGISANEYAQFPEFRWDIENAERFFNLPAEDIRFVISQLESVTELPRLFLLLEKANYGRWIAEKVTDFEARYRLNNPTVAIHNRYKLLEEKFGERHTQSNLYVLPPYPPTDAREQDTADMLHVLYSHWTGVNSSEKAQARRYLENTFHLRVEEFDLFLNHLQLTLPDSPDWNALYRLVAEGLLRRDKQYLRPHKPQHEGFFAAPDATLLRSDRPDESHARWRTFGRTEDKKRDKTSPVQDAELGLVIESPLLEMKEGTRTIILNLHDADLADELNRKFDFFMSVADEKTPFHKIESHEVFESTKIKLILKPEHPAIVSPTDAVFRPVVSSPVLKIVWKGDAANYEETTKRRIEKISLSVTAADVMPDTAWNDEGEVNAKRPFEPFGSHPRVGSKFTFAHTEIGKEAISDITLKLEWMGKPNFNSHYAQYMLNPALTDNSFKARAIDGNRDITLFSDDSSKVLNGISGKSKRILELQSPDFQHDRYLQLISGATGTTVTTTTIGDKTTAEITPRPNPPYTPKLQSFKLDYETKEVTVKSDPTYPHRIWQLHPFGIAMPDKGEKLRLVPELPYEAELYIGIEDIHPGQSVNILFQMAEGSADPELERRPLSWHYLSAVGWRAEDPRTQQPLLLSDPTDGLTRSGVLRFHLPANAVADSPLLPQGKYWLRAAIAGHRGSVCDIIGLHPQALSALRVLEPGGSDDPGIALPPGSATALQQRLPGIKALTQPYSSFGGRSAEGDADFYRRIAERLRHKQRAIQRYDIERLLLEQFPELYRVKCLPAEETPGLVDIIVLPDQRGRLPQDPLQPRLPQAELDRMAAWLQAQGPQIARYRLRNARFLPLLVEAQLRLRPGYDEAYYLQQLREELTRYLSPWAYDDNADIRFGGTVYVGQVLNFIEERPYVDYLTGLTLNWEDLSGKKHQEYEQATAPSPDVVWVSVSDTAHRLYLAESFVPHRPRRGIGAMAVKIDFLIA